MFALAILSKELLESLESSTDVLLGNLCQGVYLSEGSGNTALTTGNENTSSDDCFLRLALESLCIIDQLEQVLGSIGDILGNVNGVAVSTDLLVCCEKTLGGLVVGGLVLGAHEVTAASVAILKGDGGSELGTIEEEVRTVTDTRRIIVG